MNRADRRAIERLPVSLEPWQARFERHPTTIDGVQLLGTLVVTDGRGGLRVVGPVAVPDPDLLIGLACLTPPAPSVPARPGVIVCADGETRALIEKSGLKTTLRVGPTPEADDTLAGVVEASRGLTAPPIPGLTVEVARWKLVLGRLCRSEGRQALDRQPLQFVGHRTLEVGRAMLVADGASFAVLFHPDGGGSEEDPHWRLEVGELAELDRDERQSATKGGWVFGGLVPCAFAADPPPMARALTDDEQRRFLAATEAITLLCEDSRATSKTADTMLGRIEVRRPPPPPPRSWLVGDRKMVAHDLRSAAPTLLISQRKSDALYTVSCLQALTDVAATRTPDGTRLDARIGPVVVGELAAFQAPITADRIRLVVQQGGPRGDYLRPADVLLERWLPLVGASAERAPVRVDPVFQGPSSGWPKASAAVVELMRYAAGDEACGTIPDDAYKDLAIMATTVYSAVAAADHWDDPAPLAELRASSRGIRGLGEVLEGMIAEKRRRFGGDPRMAMVDGIVHRNGERVVQVLSTMPPHLR